MHRTVIFLISLLLTGGSPLWALRIVSLLPSNTEILESIGSGPEVVAVTRFDGLLRRRKDVADIGDFMHPNVERIVALKPDLIVAGYWTSSHIVPRLKKMGYEVVQIRNPVSLEEIYTSIEMLADAVGRPEAAGPVVLDMRKRFEDVRRRAKTLRRWKMYIEIDTPYWTIGGRDYLNEAMALAGVDNIFSDVQRPSAQVAPELIVERNPELIVTFNAKRQEISDREGWGGIAAIKQQRIIDDFSQDILSRPSPPLAAGMQEFIGRLEAWEKR